MAFKHDRAKSLACHHLLRMGGLERFWSTSDVGYYGPTLEACGELINIHSETSSLGFRSIVLLRVAFDFWSGTGHASIASIIQSLDHRLCQSIGELVTAAASSTERDIDAWMERWRDYRIPSALC